MLRFLRPARALPLVILVLFAAPAGANAWQVTVHVHGAGAITETTDRHLMDCTTPSYSSETTVTDCFAGSHADGYASFDIVKLEASVPETYFTRGWRFVKWVDSSSAGKINCDPQGTTGNHFVTSCQFQIFDDLSADLYFDDVAAPSDTEITDGPSPRPARRPGRKL